MKLQGKVVRDKNYVGKGPYTREIQSAKEYAKLECGEKCRHGTMWDMSIAMMLWVISPRSRREPEKREPPQL